MISEDATDFGFINVSRSEKTRLVGEVFSSVADNYDLMNDLMSLGVHRIWKWIAIQELAPLPGDHVLDIAGGTGDLALQLHNKVSPGGSVTLADINARMLEHGRDRFIDRGLLGGMDFVRANAETLPFAGNSFDKISIAFGLRNVTDKQQALESMYRVLRYGGRLVILEFSRVVVPLLARIYDQYSFSFIPWLGKQVAGDEASYQYLVESIRKHPDQDTLSAMLSRAGFDSVSYRNLSGGIVALHSGYKL
ncbi:MAG: bifunctional demethylmenaquinone methyltransferase/2-methoxy-6-polyprenyl-1,4-benzoquinol methylase UbiE [Thiotrichales bacterium]|nr:bifunctional demethylmenaquinone methyltransferase/2-methoxy-6-polyprenyl-1,4-benzoquinol methylase UbiE [Thiotrichales bacterium]